MVRSKDDLFDALQFNQYITPPKKDALLTVRFMVGILHDRYWMMKATEVKHLRACAYPPTKERLAGMVSDALLSLNTVDKQLQTRIKRTVTHIRSKKPCSKWMLLVLAQMDPDHFVFSKAHTRAVARPHQHQKTYIVNPNGFFDGLQLGNKQRKGRLVNLMGPAGVQREKVARMQEKAAKLQSRLQEAQEALNDAEMSSSIDEAGSDDDVDRNDNRVDLAPPFRLQSHADHSSGHNPIIEPSPNVIGNADEQPEHAYRSAVSATSNVRALQAMDLNRQQPSTTLPVYKPKSVRGRNVEAGRQMVNMGVALTNAVMTDHERL